MRQFTSEAVVWTFPMFCCAKCPVKHACSTLCIICTEHTAESILKLMARSYRIDNKVGPLNNWLFFWCDLSQASIETLILSCNRTEFLLIMAIKMQFWALGTLRHQGAHGFKFFVTDSRNVSPEKPVKPVARWLWPDERHISCFDRPWLARIMSLAKADAQLLTLQVCEHAAQCCCWS